MALDLATAAALAGLAAEAVAVLLTLVPFLPLHTRLSRQDFARSPKRRAILEAVRADPGVPLGELMARTGVGSGTLYHHLRVLVKMGLVRIRVAGRRRLVFPASGPGSATDDAHQTALLRSRTTRTVALALLARPGKSLSDICRDVGKSPRVVYYHAKILVDADLVRSGSPSRYQDLVPTPRLVQFLSGGSQLPLEAGPGDAERDEVRTIAGPHTGTDGVRLPAAP